MAYEEEEEEEEDLIDLRSNPSTDTTVADLIHQTSLLDIQDPVADAIKPLKAFKKGKAAVKNSSESKPEGAAPPAKAASRRKYTWDEIICLAHNTKPVDPATDRMMHLGLFLPGDRIPRHIAKPPPGSTTALIYRNVAPAREDPAESTTAAQVAHAIDDFRNDLQTAAAGVPAIAYTATQAWDLVLNKRCDEHQGGSVAPAGAVAALPSSSRPVAPRRAVSMVAGDGSDALAKFFPAHYFEDSPPASPVVGGASTTTPAAAAAAAADDWWSTPWPA